MKIAVVSAFAIETHAPIHPSYAGLEWIAGLRAYYLSKMGHEVTVYCAKGSNIPGCEVKEVVEPNWSSEVEFEVYKRIKNELKNYDIVFEDTHWKPFLYEDRDYSLVSVHHDWIFPNIKPIKYADIHVCASKSHAESIGKQIGVKCYYVYHGIPVKYFPLVEEKENYIVFGGRITAYKGAHIAIGIASDLGIKLVIFGEDYNVESSEYVWSVMKACTYYNFDYLGRVSFERKINILSKAKALVLPYDSRYYSCVFEIIIIEALACGTPVFITDCRSAEREILNERVGYIAKDFKDLKDAVEMLIKGDIVFEPKKLRKYVEDRFSAERMVKDYLKLAKIIKNNEE